MSETEDPSTYEIPQDWLNYNTANLVTGRYLINTRHKELPDANQRAHDIISAFRSHDPLTDDQRAFWANFDVKKVIKDHEQWGTEDGSFRIYDLLPEWAKKIYDTAVWPDLTSH